MRTSICHFLIPQESNNYRAKLLHHSSLSFIIGFVLIIQLFLSAVLVAKPSILGFASQISPERIIELTNQERTNVGAPPLKLNPLLSEAAQRKAGDMFAFDYWAHSSPSGRDPWSFLKEVGYRYLFAGENLARDFASPEAVVAAWMASATHRENLLNPKYQEIGVSVVDGTLGGVQTTLVVQHFGTSATGVGQIGRVAAQEKIVEQKPKPTVQLTPTPTAMSIALEAPKAPPQTEKTLLNPFFLTKGASGLILLVVIGIVVLDGILAYRKKIFRLTGRSLAHFLFLAVFILIVILSTQGAIL